MIALVDIDGTIADISHRLHYIEKDPKDWDAFFCTCEKDKPIQDMIDLVRALEIHYDVVFCTGRSDRVRGETIDWLHKHVGFLIDGYNDLLMRKHGDHRPDHRVKIELVNQSDIKLEDIAFVLEDRDAVVQAWRDLGVRCLQVARGDF